MNKTIVTKLNIEYELIYMDNIITKYKEYPTGVYYGKGSRFPIEDKDRINKLNDIKAISTQPYHPIFSAMIVKEIVYNLSYDHINYRELLRYNPLIKKDTTVIDGSVNKYSRPLYDIIEPMSYEDIILKDIPNISKIDYDRLVTYCENVIDIILNIISQNNNNVLEVDIDSDEFIIIIKESILEYRYNEMLDIEGEHYEWKTE